jgi:thiamine-phosphate pyrophosphorylase
LPAVALGGMDAARFRRLARLGFVGWAAIDALTPG